LNQRPHPHQGSAPGNVPQDRPYDLGERRTAGNRYEPLGSDGVWTKRATGRAVCLAFAGALRRFEVPQEVLTGNGKQFTARFG
jgi:hypothetical protein